MWSNPHASSPRPSYRASTPIWAGTIWQKPPTPSIRGRPGSRQTLIVVPPVSAGSHQPTALAEAISFATGIRPQSAGKPEPLLFLQAAEAAAAQRPLVVGDRLDTDVLGGNRAGFTTALVLTGATTPAQAQASTGEQRPDVVLETLQDLFTDQHRELI